MLVAIASGKGGTGKTTIALNLAYSLAVNGQTVRVLDCDVEAPNTHLFLDLHSATEYPVTVLVPEVDQTTCDGCGFCSRICQFGALAVVEKNVTVFPELCHSCGGCVQLCPKKALREIPREVGNILYAKAKHFELVQGRLQVGEPVAIPVIKAVRQQDVGAEVCVIDAPPGTSCPVVAAVQDSDFVLLVTEPTPFGLHDLQLAVELVRMLKRPFAVIVNRSDLGDQRVHQYCKQGGIPIIAEIPDDRQLAEAYARGQLIAEVIPDYRTIFSSIWNRINELMSLADSDAETSARKEPVRSLT